MLSGMNHKALGSLVVLLLALSSCDTTEKSITKTHDVTGEYIDIRVQTFPTERALNKYLEDAEFSKQEVEGLARWAHPKGDLTKVKRCDIYVVEPSGVRDTNRLTTWGHELAHCIYGSFHKEGER
jgi:hypothetical protein